MTAKSPPPKSPKKKRKKPAASKKTANKALSKSTRVLLAALFLCAFLLLSLVLLSRWRESLSPTSSPPLATRPGAPVELKAPPDAPEVALEAAVVERSSLHRVVAEYVQADPPGWQVQTSVGDSGELQLRVAAPFPESPWLDGLRQALAGAVPLDPPVLEQPAAEEILLWWQGNLLARVVFAPTLIPPSPAQPTPTVKTPRPAAKPIPRPLLQGAPKVAIVMDDLGMDLATARALLAIDLPVTFAILPWNERAPQVAELAHQAGREVLIHLPMEPRGYPATKPGPEALLIGLNDGELRRRFAGYLARVPHAVGGNNHMGSRFTEDREKMQVVLGEMQGAGLFFLDSVTSGSSVGFDVARELGIPAARRDRFLDNVQDTAKIAAELRKLARLAARQGYAIGICHPYPQTLAALRQEAATFAREGVEVVPVSELLVR